MSNGKALDTDAICPKSCYALGYLRPTENLTIVNCFVTGGYEEGTLLDGTYKRFTGLETNRISHTGRIKCGTESNGGFKNITIANCVFDYCGGLALESVDGAIMEDVTINNIAMRDIVNSPIFIRLGNRARGPNNPPVGVIRRVNISNIHFVYEGGGVKTNATIDPPEREKTYPDPGMFGTMPAHGLFYPPCERPRNGPRRCQLRER